MPPSRSGSAETSRAVADTTVLIALAKVGRLDLLPRLFSDVMVPEEVVGELDLPPGHRHGDSGAAIRRSVSSLGFRVVPVLRDRPRGLPRTLGGGEAAAIAAAVSMPGSTLLTDDRAARRVAPLLGLECHGTLWVVAEANARGTLSAAEAGEAVAALVRTGLRVSSDVVADVLSKLR